MALPMPEEVRGAEVMKDLLSLAVLALIIFSKFLGGFLVLTGLLSVLVVVLFASENDLSLLEASKIL
jgi:hypothetical protein